MTAGADWLAYEEALERVLTVIEPLPSETVPVDQALGRALRNPVVSRVDHPAWHNSAMDGFAIHADDVTGASADHPLELPVVGSIPAGAFPEGPLRRGTAVRVMTGAPVPDGATGVIRVEHTRRSDAGVGDRTVFLDDSDAHRHIRLRGEDVRAGDVILDEGETVTPAATGLLAMACLREVEVGRRPRVAVLTNGDELAGPDAYDQVLAGRRIANSNGPALVAQLRDAGAEPLDLGIARDDPASLRERIESAGEVDAWVAAAGVSVGEHDHVKRVLAELGWERAFWRVRMRPGSATTFGTLAGRPFWGVPGNPVSAMVAFEVLVRPAIRALAGHRRLYRTRIPATSAVEITGPRDVTSFVRVRVASTAGRLEAAPSGLQGSAMLSSMRADALLILPEGVASVPPGGAVQLIPLVPWSAAG